MALPALAPWAAAAAKAAAGWAARSAAGQAVRTGARAVATGAARRLAGTRVGQALGVQGRSQVQQAAASARHIPARPATPSGAAGARPVRGVAAQAARQRARRVGAGQHLPVQARLGQPPAGGLGNIHQTATAGQPVVGRGGQLAMQTPGQAGRFRGLGSPPTSVGPGAGPAVPGPIGVAQQGANWLFGRGSVFRAGTRYTLATVAGVGLTSQFAAAVRRTANAQWGEGSDKAVTEAQLIEDAVAAYARGDVGEAERLMEEAELSGEQLDLIAGEIITQAQEQRGQDVVDAQNAVQGAIGDGQGPTVMEQIDSLAAQVPGANQAGMPPTAFAGLNSDFNAMQADLWAQEGMEQWLPQDQVFTGLSGAQVDPFQQTDVGTFSFFGDPHNRQQVPSTQSIMRLRGEIFGLSDEELIDLQHKLFATGFYGQTPYDNIRFGSRDPRTMAAFESLLEHAAMHTQWANMQGGGWLTWDQLLESMVDEVGGVEDALAEDQPHYVVTLTHPDTVRNALRNIGPNTIGRGLSASDEQRMVAFIHGQQRSAQLTAQRASVEGEGGGTTEVMQPDVGASLEEELRRRFPTEAGAADLGRTYDDFLRIIGA